MINKTILLRIDCKTAKDILEKDIKNLPSKHIFARCQALLEIFEIEYIKRETNSFSDFLIREFLRGV